MASSHPCSFSLQIGTWHRVPIRIHALFVAFSVATVGLACLADRYAAAHLDLVGIACLSVAILLVSVLVHGLAHLCVAEGDPEACPPHELVIGPLGEFSPFPCRTAAAELRVALAGPASNFCLALIAGAFLRLFREPDLLGLLHPLAPVRLVEGPWGLVVAKLVLWINWMIVLANVCLPVRPLDGRKILRSLVAARWPDGERAMPARTMVLLARAVCILLFLVAWLVRSQDFYGVLPAWCVLMLVALFFYLGAREECQYAAQNQTADAIERGVRTERPPSFAESAQRTSRGEPWCGACAPESLEPSCDRTESPSCEPTPDWKDDEQRLDDILIRVHQVGLDHLTPAERAWLAEASARLRQRLEA